MRYRKELATTGRRLLSIQPRRKKGGASRHKIDIPGRSYVRGVLRSNADLRRRLGQLKGIRERASRYESLFVNSPDIVYYLNREGTFIPLSDSTIDVLGYANENVQLEDYVHEVVHPEDRVKVLTSYYNSVAAKERDIKGITFRVSKSNGEILWMELHARINYDEKGEFLEEVGFLRDVSERKQMDENLMNLNRELEETNRKLQAAYQWMRDSRDILKTNRYEEDIGFLVDENGRIEWSSEKALGFTGRARSLLIGSCLPEMIAEDSRAAFVKALQQGWKGIVKNPFFTVFAKEGEGAAVAEVKITRLTSHEKRRLWILVQRPASKPRL